MNIGLDPEKKALFNLGKLGWDLFVKRSFFYTKKDFYTFLH